MTDYVYEGNLIQMVKILFLVESLAGGGAEKVLSDIVCNLNKNKYEVTVCTITDGDIYQDKVSRACEYCSFLRKSDYEAGGFRKLAYWIKLQIIYRLPAQWVYRIFIRRKYDIEVAFIEGFATKLIAASTNHTSKKFAWVHTDIIRNAYADSCYKSLNEQKRTYRHYDSIVCVSKSVREVFLQKMRISKNVVVRYNPVNELEIVQQSSENISVSKESGILLGTVGRLEQQKGYLRLLRCVDALHREGYDLELWIIGEGSQRREMEKYIQEHHMEGIIKLLGFQQNPYKYVNKCDFFICSSYAEGFSTAATESLILGKPIMTVDCSGMKELFGGEHCGEIVPNTDADLYKLLKRIANKEIITAQYEQAVRRRAVQFSMRQRMLEIENIFNMRERL